MNNTNTLIVLSPYGLFRDDETIMKQMEQNIVKNSNWYEVNQSAV